MRSRYNRSYYHLFVQGCKLLIYPGAFNMTTGPAHWELLQRCRAIDNQVDVELCLIFGITISNFVLMLGLCGDGQSCSVRV